LKQRYRSFSSYLSEIYGCRVQKISLDAGLGCPNRDGVISHGGCIYCNFKGSGTGAFSRGETILQQVRHGISFLERRYKAKKFLGYFQSFSNTYGPTVKLKTLYNEALSHPEIVGLCIGTRPDCLDMEKIYLMEEISKKYLVWLELGMQSSHNSTLALINRGHDFECFAEKVRDAHNANLPVCAHVILGLPDEDASMMLKTAQRLSELSIDGVKIHLLYVIKDTVLGKWFYEGKYQCLERVAYLEIVKEFIKILPQATIIQRLISDPHPNELVAPVWALDKKKNLEMLHELLEDEEVEQGMAFKGSVSVNDMINKRIMPKG